MQTRHAASVWRKSSSGLRPKRISTAGFAGCSAAYFRSREIIPAQAPEKGESREKYNLKKQIKWKKIM